MNQRFSQEPEGRMCLIEEFSFFQGSKAENGSLDPAVQRVRGPSIIMDSFLRNRID